MNRYRFVFALAIALAIVPAAAAQKKVWTNEDLEALRAKGGISIMHPEMPAAPAAVGTEALTATEQKKAYVPKEKDPEWYREQLAALLAELDAKEDQINFIRAFRKSGKTIQGGLNLAADNMRLTPENEVAQLQAESLVIRQHINDVEDLARRNEIAPGLIRVG